MPQLLAPGVYVEEVPSGLAPIAGVGTSTAGFVGIVANNVRMPLLPGRPPDPNNERPADHYTVAPALEAQLITSWESFKSTFGDVQTGNNVLAHAVYGFFVNGGTRCWVTRVVAGADAAATNGNLIKGLDTFRPIDEIALVAVPGAVTNEVQTAIVDHCESEHLQDRFAILDGRETTKLTKADIQGTVRDSTYGAIYFPWIRVFDPDTNATITQPPSGHLAGVFARVDASRGVHKAPANEVIRGALDVALLLSRADQAGLNPEDINVIRKFDGNITVWGAHTLAGKENAEWRYINIRRLFLFLRESIEEGTQWAVFEPNDRPLWGKIVRNVTAFLTTVWRSGALFGATAQEAFFVQCDESNNPPESRALGVVNIDVGVAVVRPAEFVVFRITQWEPPAA